VTDLVRDSSRYPSRIFRVAERAFARGSRRLSLLLFLISNAGHFVKVKPICRFSNYSVKVPSGWDHRNDIYPGLTYTLNETTTGDVVAEEPVLGALDLLF
jgi:hypothetical protein